MGRGLSAQQRQLLATLIVAKRPLDVTRELGPLVDAPATDSGRRSLLRAVRSLAARGLVELTRTPRQGWPAVVATARPGAVGELRAPDWQRAAAAVDKAERRLEKARQKAKAKRPDVYRGKAHPPRPAGEGLECWVENLSRYPEEEVLELVGYAVRWIDMRGVHIKVKNAGPGRVAGGRAYSSVPTIANVAPGSLYLITLKIGPPDDFPSREHRYGWTEPGPRNQFPLLTYADWREALVAVAAHEAMHIQQYKYGHPRSELQTSHFEADTLERYRKTLPKGNT